MLRPVTFCAPALSAPASLARISLSSIDIFDTDNEGWRVGDAGVDPAFNDGTSFNGQPGFLRHFFDGGGPTGKVLMWTQRSDWTGDDLPFWIGFDGPGGWFFAPAQTLVTASGWERFEFDIAPDALIYQADSGGTGSVTDTLSGVTRFEIFAPVRGPVAYAANGDLLRAGTSNSAAWFDGIATAPSPGAAAMLLVAGIAVRRRR